MESEMDWNIWDLYNRNRNLLLMLPGYLRYEYAGSYYRQRQQRKKITEENKRIKNKEAWDQISPRLLHI